ncbi:MAG: transposase [Plectolyngbya sp. WJT66-NPBG17]|nr:transposase [Plectolyngbya sp. WJT66-NPBG17]
MFYQLKNGCDWEDLPKDLPSYSTVFWHYKQWRKEDVFDEIQQALHSQVQEQVVSQILFSDKRSISFTFH